MCAWCINTRLLMCTGRHSPAHIIREGEKGVERSLCEMPSLLGGGYVSHEPVFAG